jgi:hypothetical protein
MDVPLGKGNADAFLVEASTSTVRGSRCVDLPGFEESILPLQGLRSGRDAKCEEKRREEKRREEKRREEKRREEKRREEKRREEKISRIKRW